MQEGDTATGNASSEHTSFRYANKYTADHTLRRIARYDTA
jgi:hypothetical protein